MSGSGRPFARIERLAASLLGARHAFVHLADGERERLLAAGQRAEESPDAALLGGRPLLPARPLVVGDASRHPRLHSHQAVAGEAAIRFIAAAPLLTEEGELLGVLHVMDPRPRGPLSTSECENLAALAELACDELVLRGAAPAAPATPALAARLTSRELEETRRRARDDERLRLARELHDGLGKDLFGLALLLESVADRQKGRAVSHELREYAATTRRLANEARTLLRTFRDPEGGSPPDGQFLEARLRGAASDHEDAGGPPVKLELSFGAPVPAWAVHELERIVREALRNVRRHSEASSVRVAVGQFDDQLTLTVEDDGRGLPTELPPGSYGLVGMRERAELLGGELEVVSRPQGGAVVRGRFALARLQEGVRGE